jgi:hypothetical protein
MENRATELTPELYIFLAVLLKVLGSCMARWPSLSESNMSGEWKPEILDIVGLEMTF